MLEKIPTLFLYRAENIERKRRETGRESLLKKSVHYRIKSSKNVDFDNSGKS